MNDQAWVHFTTGTLLIAGGIALFVSPSFAAFVKLWTPKSRMFDAMMGEQKSTLFLRYFLGLAFAAAGVLAIFEGARN